MQNPRKNDEKREEFEQRGGRRGFFLFVLDNFWVSCFFASDTSYASQKTPAIEVSWLRFNVRAGTVFVPRKRKTDGF